MYVKSHLGCSYFHSLSGCSLLLGECASDRPLCAPLTTFLFCLKRPALVQCLLYLFIFLTCEQLSWKHKTCSHFCCTVFWKFKLLMCFMRTFRGRWTQRRYSQKDVTTQCEMGFKPMWLFLHGLWGNGLKAPWQSSVCFRAAAYSFCSVQIQFYCFRFLHASCNISPPLGFFPLLIPAPYSRVQTDWVQPFTLMAVPMARMAVNHVGIWTPNCVSYTEQNK